MKLFHITIEQVVRLEKMKIPIGSVILLEIMNEGKEVPEDMLKHLQYLQRKGYVDIKGSISKFGKELYDSLFLPAEQVKTAKKKAVDKEDDFEKWWNVYPATNHFTHKNKEFKGVQNKRIRKEDCRKLFFACTNGATSPEDLIRATKYHFETAKDLSVKSGDNQLSYIPNSERYLREKRYEAYIEISKSKKLSPTNIGAIDI